LKDRAFQREDDRYQWVCDLQTSHICIKSSYRCYCTQSKHEFSIICWKWQFRQKQRAWEALPLKLKLT